MVRLWMRCASRNFWMTYDGSIRPTVLMYLKVCRRACPSVAPALVGERSPSAGAALRCSVNSRKARECAVVAGRCNNHAERPHAVVRRRWCDTMRAARRDA